MLLPALMAAFGGSQPPQDPNETDLQSMLDAAHQQTMQEQAAQQSALTDYNTAANEPQEGVDPTAAALSMALSRLGTTLAGPHGPNYSAQNAAEIGSKNKALEANRTDNLTRLRATYEAAAQRAAQAGNHEAEIKARTAIHKIDSQQKKEDEAAKEKNDQAVNAMRESANTETARHNKAMEGLTQAGIDAKKQGATSDIQDMVDNNTRTVSFKDGTSVDYIDATNLKGKDLTAAQQIAAKTGKPLLAGKQVDSVNEVENARNTVTNYMKAIKPYLGQSVLDPKRLTTPFSAWVGAGDVASVKAYNEAMIQIIPALITRGIRITQGEIKQLQKNTPSLSDPINVAQGKATIYEDILDRVARRQVSIGKNRNKMFQQTPANTGEQKANYKFNPATGKIEAING